MSRLKLALFGFAFLDSAGADFLIILCNKEGYIRLAFMEIGFVLHNTLKMVTAFCSDQPAFGINRRDRQDRGEDRDCISLLCHELRAFFSVGSAFSVVRNMDLGVAGHEKSLLICSPRIGIFDIDYER